MWYFAWLLGLPLAAAFAVLNAIWFELMDDEATRRKLLERTKSLPDA
ncbi:cytochrome bd biosynthesis protein [Comamonas testosteroni]|jgi:cyd operon protein YbgT|uniref:Cyd operon protein YbgT n=3 Tax=Comamonas TaxID=283 RepID=A0A096C104_COMTE|nr:MULTISPECIES: cytochrome bd-I oxidase subunit CydX [Comamonas]ACY34176.1 cyd operon protein YbgT [Comamonas thiooxydans]EED66260.1 cyd operon protein YbgT [Comamonas testosteroni KF-1]EFI61586.1 cyd operon protein YbgT [Comamonas thiooxydans]EHN66300.1 cyd operon protein YbgT [Comamonas testosteroni ATCC 11996]KGG86887.1 cyd operon protein YbgT [Comamonas thiooxydans]